MRKNNKYFEGACYLIAFVCVILAWPFLSLKSKNMRKYFIIAIAIAFASCSKDVEIIEIPVIEIVEVPEESVVKTGIQFRPFDDFEADAISYVLTQGVDKFSSYGQTLTESYNEIPPGNYIIHGIKAIKDGEEVNFVSYTVVDGQRREVKETSVVRVEDGKLFKIFLSK